MREEFLLTEVAEEEEILLTDVVEEGDCDLLLEADFLALATEPGQTQPPARLAEEDRSACISCARQDRHLQHGYCAWCLDTCCE